MNEVDRLLAQIKEIQEKCSHVFETSPHYDRWVHPQTGQADNPEPTLVPNVFVGVDDQRRISLTVKFVCKKCNVGGKANCRQKCVRCLGPMVKGEKHLREEYFGEKYSYYRVYLYICEMCGFTIAVDEFDQ